MLENLTGLYSIYVVRLFFCEVCFLHSVVKTEREMKRIVVLLFLAACLSEGSAQSRDELIEAYRSGTLTQEQIDGLKRQYGITDEMVTTAVSQDNKSRLRSHVPTNPASQSNQNSSSFDDANSISSKSPMAESASGFIPTAKTILETAPIAENRRTIFGHNIFRSADLSFSPNLNIATPANYVLGPGDEIIIDLWGNTQQTLRKELSPEGCIVLEGVGPVSVTGLTIKEAEKRLRGSLGSLYEGLADGSVKMMLSLGRIRSIKVDVLGEVTRPGGYTLPSLATLFHALYSAGGVSDIGSMRSIRLYRQGRQVAEVDGYEYILSGRQEQDVGLQDGDLIVVPTYDCLVDIVGHIKRPMLYEMRRGESLSDAIRFAGDFSAEANRRRVNIVRRQGQKSKTYTVGDADFDTFMLVDGDSISIGGGINRYDNRVEVRGAVSREGFYAIDDTMQSVGDLLRRADGLREDAFMPRALLYREGEGLMPEVLSIDLEALVSGRGEDIALRPNDMLAVSSVDELHQDYNVGIYGAVGRSGDYPYAENMSVEDLIVAAGGLLESASTANVIVTRRIKRPTSLNAQEQLFETFVIDISDDLAVADSEFRLQPFDQVFVRRSPVYITQSSVTVEGEVAFAGRYPLLRRNMRLSEIIAEAGMPTSSAFIEGAYLLRKMTDEERAQSDALQTLIDMQRGDSSDSVGMAGLRLSSLYPVGINLSEALAHPGSDADVVVRDGDLIAVPKYNGTVRVMGAVLYPNSVTYKEGRRLKYYINAAGGFANRARKRRTFVIYMNGMVEAGPSTKIRPGCVVIVPSKSPALPLRWTDIAGFISTSASTAAVVMSAINIVNK